MSELYPNGCPKGEWNPLTDEQVMKTKHTREELDLQASLFESQLKSMRQAAEVHREIRMFARRKAQPGVKLYKLCCDVEDHARKILGMPNITVDGNERVSGLHSGPSGLAFPCGVSLNEVAAHYTPNPGDDTVIKSTDILKFDIGTHVDGHVIDSACTMHWKPHFDTLSMASREATNVGVSMAGPDACLADIGDAIEEVITSYEATIDGKTTPIVPIRNLYGHTVGQYKVHAGKSIPCIKNSGIMDRMQIGECFALETFASTGKGVVHNVDNGPAGTGRCSHYMVGHKSGNPSGSAGQTLKFIKKQFGTLAFCPRWIDRDWTQKTSWRAGLSGLEPHREGEASYINPYPPLADVAGSYTSQHEHTFIVLPNGVEVLSRGDDY